MSLPKDPSQRKAYREKKSAAARARAERERELLREWASRGGLATAAKKTPQEHQAKMLELTATRELKYEEARRRGESLDKLAPEKRSEIGRKGGHAAAAARNDEEKDKVGDLLAAGRVKGLDVAHARARAIGSHLDRPIKLPSSGRRNAPFRYIKILKRVCRERSSSGGWAFDGTIAKPGATVTRRELWPDREYPPIPVLLECAGSIQGNRGAFLWVLWRLSEGQWLAIARTEATATEWAENLGPAAERALLPAPDAIGWQQRYSVDPAKMAAFAYAGVERILRKIKDRPTREATMAIFHDMAAAGWAREMDDVSDVTFEPVE